MYVLDELKDVAIEYYYVTLSPYLPHKHICPYSANTEQT